MPELNRNIVTATFAVTFGLAFELGYNIGVLNQIEMHIKHFFISTYSRRGLELSDSAVILLWSFTTAIFLIGGMVGASFAGALADRIGRKGCVFVSHGVIAIGAVVSFLCQIAGSPELLMLGRLILGIDGGIVGCVSITYLAEISTPAHRGSLITMQQLFLTTGILVSSVFGIPPLFGQPDRWHYLFLLELVPVTISGALLIFIPDTPTYLLLLRDKPEEARKALMFYRKSINVDVEFERALKEGMEGREIGEHSYSVKELFSARHRRMTFIACMLQVMQMFCGINAVLYYSVSIFKQAGVSDFEIPYVVLILIGVLVLMTAVAVPVMDRVGRRPLLLITQVVMIILQSVLTVTSCKQTSYQPLVYLGIVCVVLFAVAYSLGLGPLAGLMSTELFSRGSRPKGMSLVTMINCSCAFIFLFLFPIVQFYLECYTLLVFVGVLVFFTVFTIMYIPETKNQTFEQIMDQRRVQPAESAPT